MTWIMKAFHQFEVVDIRTKQQLLQAAGFGKTGRELLRLALELISVVIGISKENGAVDLLWMKSRAVLHHLPLIELHDGSPPKLLIFACTHSMPLQT
jgi:hypothetical protein